MRCHHLLSGLVLGVAALIVFSAVPSAAQTFSDQTGLGIGFVHHADVADDLAMGAGGAWADYDGDGDLDIYVADRIGANVLYQNQGAGVAFVDVAASLGVEAVADESTGALWGDYDNDGDQDLYVMNRGGNIMFRNDGSDGAGGWIFTDVTATLGVAGFARTAAAVYGDYDNDGWLDLYVGNHYYEFFKPIPGGATTSADALYHNEDDGQGGRVFVDIAPDTFGTAILFESLAHSVGFLDYDNDGDLDIFVVNEKFGNDPLLLGNIMWRNDGDDGAGGWTFTDATVETGTVLTENPMGLAIGDYNNDGNLDFIMSDSGANLLYRNNGAGAFDEVATQAGVDRFFVPGPLEYKQVGWGLVFADFDLDGAEDLYVATGGIGAESRGQPNPLFINNFDPPTNTFTDVTDASGANDDRRARTVIKGDYDLDGDEDLYVVNYNDEAILYRNEQVGGDHLVVGLTGVRSNRDAIGAIVRVNTGLGNQWRMVQSGSTTGGSHDRALYFGVTGQGLVSSIDVDWPSGTHTLLTNQGVNQRLQIQELQATLGDASYELDEFGRLQNLETQIGNQLGDFRLYVAVNGAAPLLLGPDDFDIVNSVSITDNGSASRLLSIDGTLQVDVTAELRNVGANRQGLKMRVKVTNLSGASMDIKHYVYYDWNIGDAAGDQGRQLSAARIRQRDAAAFPGRNYDMSANRDFTHWEVDTTPDLLDKLEQAATAIDLVDTVGLVTGDLANAMQFDATVPTSSTWQVVHNFVY